jgi:hypothetical protein
VSIQGVCWVGLVDFSLSLLLLLSLVRAQISSTDALVIVDCSIGRDGCRRLLISSAIGQGGGLVMAALIIRRLGGRRAVSLERPPPAAWGLPGCAPGAVSSPRLSPHKSRSWPVNRPRRVSSGVQPVGDALARRSASQPTRMATSNGSELIGGQSGPLSHQTAAAAAAAAAATLVMCQIELLRSCSRRPRYLGARI